MSRGGQHNENKTDDAIALALSSREAMAFESTKVLPKGIRNLNIRTFSRRLAKRLIKMVTRNHLQNLYGSHSSLKIFYPVKLD